MDRITNLLESIPGYDGYRDKENRRETDRRVRERIGRRLGDLAREVELVAAELASQRQIDSVGPVDDLAKAIRHLQDLIQTASYGYGGLYSDREVDSAALDQLNAFDNDLLNKVEAVQPLIAAMRGAGSTAARHSELAEVKSAVEALKSRFEERSLVVETGRPATPSATSSPLTVLEGETSPAKRPAALELLPGDALALGGENFLVDSRIAIEGGQPMRLLRIDTGPDRWLLVSERFAADLKPADLPASGDEVTVEGQTLRLHGSGTGPASVTGSSGESREQAVTFRLYGGESATGPLALTLEWPAESLYLTGTGISFDEIEVFGKPATR
jgi:archaellum component FlaC